MQVEGASSAWESRQDLSISARALGSDQGLPLTEHLLTGDSASHPTPSFALSTLPLGLNR